MRKESREVVLWFVVLVIGFFMAGFLAADHAGRADGSWVWTTLLFAPPLLQTLNGASLPKRSLLRAGCTWGLTISVLVHIGIWSLYINVENIPVPLLPLTSFTILGASFLLAVFAFLMTKALVTGRRGPGIFRRMESELKEHPFVALCFFMVIFLYVTYSVTFSLAFYDRACGGAALYSNPQIYQSVEKMPGTVNPTGSPTQVVEGHDITRLDPNLQEVYRRNCGAERNSEEIIEFEESDLATVRFDENFLRVLVGKDRMSNRYPVKDALVRQNTCALAMTIRKIQELGAEERKQIKLEGHSTITDLARQHSSYNSNYELSEGRVRQVRLHIMEELDELAAAPGSAEVAANREIRWQNAEWLEVPFSNDEARGGNQGEGRVSRRNAYVEVFVIPMPEHPTQWQIESLKKARNGTHRLSLLDYLYFSIYTITTTGYGDIIPVKPYVRFVTSVANLYEVFFLVVFFNALFSAAANEQLRKAVKAANGAKADREAGQPVGGPSQ